MRPLIEVCDHSEYSDSDLLVIVKKLGWLVIGKQAYCPACQRTAAKIVKAKRK